jgi:predicted lysophospholipase L1 biosynthesis ABC-type transport system permease subunit
MAHRMWPGEDPIGKGINSNGSGGEAGFYRVVGVVPELRAATLEQGPSEAVFYPSVPVPKTWIWGPLRGATYVVRTSLADPTALTPAVRRTLTALDARVPIANVTPMSQVVERSMARVSFIMLLLGVAAVIAFLLSGVGIYGVIAYVVGQRRGEIGIRMALGARSSQVSGLVVLQSVRLAAVGVLVGLLGAVAATRVLQSLLFEVSSTDPMILGAVATMLIVLAAAASYAPARRAARVDPVEALRAE